MALRRFVIPVTVDENGDAEVYSPQLSGKVISLRYVKDDFTNTDSPPALAFTITSEDGGETIWAEEAVEASATRYPRIATHSTAGVAATLDGTRPALTPIALSADRVKFVIAGAGDETSGTFHITLDD